MITGAIVGAVICLVCISVGFIMGVVAATAGNKN